MRNSILFLFLATCCLFSQNANASCGEGGCSAPDSYAGAGDGNYGNYGGDCAPPCAAPCAPQPTSAYPTICYKPYQYNVAIPYCTRECRDVPYTYTKQNCRMVPEYYTTKHVRYIPQCYTKTHCRQKPEYYTTTHCATRKEYYTQKRCRYEPRFFYKKEVSCCNTGCEVAQPECNPCDTGGCPTGGCGGGDEGGGY